ncbi:MAG: hypothetical protein Q8Q09_22240 [Deltaproteobacteria bacterium]|nr:hypothetical protein [Deltaproteobacteria bacterium]
MSGRTVEDVAARIVRQHRSGRDIAVDLANHVAEGVLHLLRREGYAVAKDCLDQITDSRLRDIALTMVGCTATGAMTGAALGGRIAGETGALAGAVVGGVLGAAVGATAVLLWVESASPGRVRIRLAAR